jgi:predicted transcriptional regulator
MALGSGRRGGARAADRWAAEDPGSQLGKRERQIMEIVYRRGRATAAEVLADLADPPSYSSVRAMLRYLEDKGHLRHEEEGPRYVYLPTAPAAEVRSSALSHVVRTFFDGSVTTAVAALLETKGLSHSEYERLSRLLEGAREEEGDGR